MQRIAFLTGVIFALTAVMLGAFGAHGLKPILSPEQLSSFETGVRYQFYHALVLLGFAWRNPTISLRFERIILLLFVVGTCLFSFSIYCLNLQQVWEIRLSWLGPITPIGGSLLIIGWILLLVDAIRLFIHKAP